MKDVYITPKDMFALIGSTLSQSVSAPQEDQNEITHQVRVAKIDLEMSIEITPDLQKSHLPSNQNLKLDGYSEKAYFKIKVIAY